MEYSSLNETPYLFDEEGYTKIVSFGSSLDPASFDVNMVTVENTEMNQSNKVCKSITYMWYADEVLAVFSNGKKFINLLKKKS